MRAWTCQVAVYCLLLALWPVTGSALTVEGVTDQSWSWEEARYRVVVEPGFEYQAELDGVASLVGEWVGVRVAGYHELTVARTATVGGGRETARYRFVIVDRERGGSEYGLAPWTPQAWVGSAPAEYAGGRLDLMLPRAFPAGMAMPAVAWVRAGADRRLGVNGVVELRGGGVSRIVVRRGVGSGFLPAAPVALGGGELAVAGQVAGLEARRVVAIDGGARWQPVGETIAEDTWWPAQGRLAVSANLRIAAGARLTVGAGAVVRLAPGVEIQVDGELAILGTRAEPVVFLPERREAPWGGFVLGQAPARVAATGAIFTGSGADADWYGKHPSPGGVHRREQALFHLGPGVEAVLTDCALIDLAGQAFHGDQASLVLEGSLVQRCLTSGQFNGGAVQVRASALIEFPSDDAQFLDADTDAIYLTLGTHWFTDSLIGWAKDDGIDAGGSTAGRVSVDRCWIEACFHEGLALSGAGKVVEVAETVLMNNGQAVESGYYSPEVTVRDSLLLGNGVGARFGDNYESTHTGFLAVTNSILLHNRRDAWGFVRELWGEDLVRLAVAGNYLTQADPLRPANTVWQPAQDGSRLAAFGGAAAGVVGVGFLAAESQHGNGQGVGPIAVGLSTFATREVVVGYAVRPSSARAGADYRLAAGTVRFTPGQVVQSIPLEVLSQPERRFSVSVELALVGPVNADWAGAAPRHRARLMVGAGPGDSDGDGLPDAWEETVVGADADDEWSSLADVWPDDDPDGDGSDNGAEYVAGTHPLLESDRLVLATTPWVGGGWAARFVRKPGRRYRLEAVDALGPAAEWRVVAEVPASGGEGEQVVPLPLPLEGARRFFRLAVFLDS